MAPTSSKPVKITYTVGSDATLITEEFDFLVVACDPRNLKVSDTTKDEEDINSKLKSFTFFTTLFKAQRSDHLQQDPNTGALTLVPNFGCRFDLAQLESMSGAVYGFRDEVMTREENVAEKSGSTYVTVYQLDGQPLIGKDAEQARERLVGIRDSTIKNTSGEPSNNWIDFDPFIDQHGDRTEGRPEETQLVDYFPHFDFEDLNAGLPWKIRDLQGENHTLYVSSFTCFESVLHCYLYENWLMNENKKVQEKFPANRDAKIAICGAGPSGLLFASQHLKKKGYSNFTIFESSHRYGGKTLTINKTAPTSRATIPCELGTCYLSASYKPMKHLFPEYNAGEVFIFDYPKHFRSIIDPEQAKNDFEKANGIDFEAWSMRVISDNNIVAMLKLAVGAIRYIVAHTVVMGTTIDDAMPDKAPGSTNIDARIDDLFLRAKEARNSADPPRPDLGSDEVPVQDMYRALRNSPSYTSPVGILGLVRDVLGLLLAKCQFETITRDAVKSASSDVMTLEFGNFLKKHKMDSLIGLFTYGYQVQGYGTLTKIPAYYGMVWMTPPVLLFAMHVKLLETDPKKKGFASATSKGWSELWNQIVKLDDLNSKIVLNAKITAIDRGIRH